MLRTDCRYPPTAHMPLGPAITDHHFEAITMPADLPVIERLTPSRACGTDACNQGRGVPCATRCDIKRLTEDDLRELQRVFARNKAAIEALRATEPPRFRLWLAGVTGAVMFAAGYLLGRWLP